MNQLKRDVENLPTSFTSDEIEDMVHRLYKDVAKLPPNLTLATKSVLMEKKHSQFAIAYPMLFVKVCANELDQDMLCIMLKTKNDIDRKIITEDEGNRRIFEAATSAVNQKNHLQMPPVTKPF
jgi:hypothetical protein